jgi:hypothetical protein
MGQTVLSVARPACFVVSWVILGGSSVSALIVMSTLMSGSLPHGINSLRG